MVFPFGILKKILLLLLLPKISFFSSVASILEPFLKKFQSMKPMVPFLYDDLSKILNELSKKFIKTDVSRNYKNL